jgi:phosphoglycolate phosphatase-like HAD superfamily hydrolase
MRVDRTPLALDFDGVLCDTTEECVVTAWNAWRRLTNERGIVKHPSQVPAHVAAQIRGARCYVKTPGEYLPVIKTALSGDRIANQTDYDRLLVEFDTEISRFAPLVLEARAAFRSSDMEEWLRLHVPYQGVSEGARRLSPYFEVFIVTGKDRATVLQFLQLLPLDVPEDRVFDNEAAKNKLAMLKRIAAADDVQLSDVFMLDDNVVHLLPPRQAGCQVFLAHWGYHTSEHLAMARESRIPLVELDTWVEALLAHRRALARPRR